MGNSAHIKYGYLYYPTDKNVNKIFCPGREQCGTLLHRPLVLNTNGQL